MEMWFSEFHTPNVKHSLRVEKHLYSKQSDYQRIDIFETPEFGRVLTLDGNVMLTERDEFIYDEMITHVPMAVHKDAKDILVIGAGDGGVVRELTRYDRVENIDLVEMDPMVVEACRAYLPGNACRMDDRRVQIHFENALKFIRRCETKYDLIIVDSSDPFGPSEGLFTREFYGNCYNALNRAIHPADAAAAGRRLRGPVGGCERQGHHRGAHGLHREREGRQRPRGLPADEALTFRGVPAYDDTAVPARVLTRGLYRCIFFCPRSREYTVGNAARPHP